MSKEYYYYYWDDDEIFISDFNQLVNYYSLTKKTLTKKDVLKILENTLKSGYKITNSNQIFKLENLIEQIKSDDDFDIHCLIVIIKNLLKMGFNLEPKNNLNSKIKKMERKEVYKCIDGEREYQNKKWNVNNGDKNNSLFDWINYIEYYLGKTKRFVYENEKEKASCEAEKGCDGREEGSRR